MLGADPHSLYDARHDAGVDGDKREQASDKDEEQQQEHERTPARTASPAPVCLHQRYGSFAVCWGKGVPGIERDVSLDPTVLSREGKQLQGPHEPRFSGSLRNEAWTELGRGLT
jgi:hypothetical protein